MTLWLSFLSSTGFWRWVIFVKSFKHDSDLFFVLLLFFVLFCLCKAAEILTYKSCPPDKTVIVQVASGISDISLNSLKRTWGGEWVGTQHARPWRIRNCTNDYNFTLQKSGALIVYKQIQWLQCEDIRNSSTGGEVGEARLSMWNILAVLKLVRKTFHICHHKYTLKKNLHQVNRIFHVMRTLQSVRWVHCEGVWCYADGSPSETVTGHKDVMSA